MIKIVFANGCVTKWSKEEYTDYKYDGKCFIIIRGDGDYEKKSVNKAVRGLL